MKIHRRKGRFIGWHNGNICKGCKKRKTVYFSTIECAEKKFIGIEIAKTPLDFRAYRRPGLKHAANAFSRGFQLSYEAFSTNLSNETVLQTKECTDQSAFEYDVGVRGAGFTFHEASTIAGIRSAGFWRQPAMFGGNVPLCADRSPIDTKLGER